MKRRHFILDTNVLMDNDHLWPRFKLFPNLTFDIQPYTVVILKPILVELDRLKRGDSEENKRARDAIKMLERFQTGESSLSSFEFFYDDDSPFLNQETPFANLIFADKRAMGAGRTIDEEIIRLAEEYANDNRDAEVIVLSGDTMMRIIARNSSSPIKIEDPTRWSDLMLEKYKYRLGVLQLSNSNEALKRAYERRKQLRDQIAALPDDKVSEDLQSELAEAEELEREEYNRVMERVHNENEIQRQAEREELKAREQAAREEREALELKERRRESMILIAGMVGATILCMVLYNFLH